MESLWGLFSHWASYGGGSQQDPPILYVHVSVNFGITGHPVFGLSLLEGSPKIHAIHPKKSLVSSLNFQIRVLSFSNKRSTSACVLYLEKENRMGTPTGLCGSDLIT